MLTLPVIALLSVLVTTLPAQRVLLVDASGRTGQYKTINAAINAFRSGDIIRVVYGTYYESITLTGKSVNIQGIGGLPSTLTGALTIQNHPEGQRSRFSRLYFPSGITTKNTSGDLLFEYCPIEGQCLLSGHTRGSISLASCRIRAVYGLRASFVVDALFLHETDVLQVGRSSWCASIVRSTVEISRCRIIAVQPDAFNNGVVALKLYSSSARISGLGSDEIIGGVSGSGPFGRNAPAIVVTGSTLDISGVRVKGGGPLAIQSVNSTVRQTAQYRIPVVDPDRDFARGGLTNIRLHTLPNSRSLTWLALDYNTTRIPLGPIVIDLGKPILSYLRSHDSQGLASIPIDLRQLPSSYIGIHYAIQTVSLSTANALALSAPRIGVIGL